MLTAGKKVQIALLTVVSDCLFTSSVLHFPAPLICMFVPLCFRYDVWVSMFGTELFHCMPAHQCDFSQGQGWVMFVLVSVGKPAVSVCQGANLGNLVCEPVSLIDNMCLFLCCLQYVCLCELIKARILFFCTSHY